MTIDHSVLIKIELDCVNRPGCNIRLGNYQHELIVDKKQSIEIAYQNSIGGTLLVEHHGKHSLDPDTALIIESISFNEISSKRLLWAGTYFPQYPSHITGPAELIQHHYLGWNGIWQLNFSLPIYTWIHKVENLGWIYD
jgi:hypothetical protein